MTDNTNDNTNDNTHRKIVCDIDDTISFTTSRDWENAKPNILLIEKLNHLYENGYSVCYHTARGSLSCATRADADIKYRKIIETWMRKNNVKYTELSFEKPLAIYYIDDKAIRPNEFVDLDIHILPGGLSGAFIEKRGGLVYKTHPNSLSCAKWYDISKNVVDTVKVHSLIGDTICIDYVESTEDLKISQIEYIINKFKEVPSEPVFDTYINRLMRHFNEYDAWYEEQVIDMMEKHKNFYDMNRSFCHGDMSLDNMISNGDRLYLIDPLYEKDSYSSWLLDVSKVLHSSRRFDKPEIHKYFVKKYDDIIEQLKILELSHWIRQRKYVVKNGESTGETTQYIDDTIDTLLNEIGIEPTEHKEGEQHS